MSGHLQQLGDAHVAVVSFADRGHLSTYRDSLLPRLSVGERDGGGIDFLADPQRLTYRALGLSRTALHRVYNPGTIRMYAGLIRRGRRFRRPTEDTRQLGGDVVLTAAGEIHAVFRPASPDTRPSVEALVDAVEQARR